MDIIGNLFSELNPQWFFVFNTIHILWNYFSQAYGVNIGSRGRMCIMQMVLKHDYGVIHCRGP